MIKNEVIRMQDLSKVCQKLLKALKKHLRHIKR